MAEFCGVCGLECSNTEEYLNHKCTTGFKPTDVEHLDATSGGRFSLQAEKAKARGTAKAEASAKPKTK